MVVESNITVVTVAPHSLHTRPAPNRQRHQPLQIIEEDLENYFEKQGCVIQRTNAKILYETESFYSMKNYFNEPLSEINYVSHNTIVEQMARITLAENTTEHNTTSQVTVNKGFIEDQNVGVSGEVFMVTPCRAGQFVTASSHCTSVKQLPTIVYIGTIQEKEEDRVIKSVDIIQTIEENDSGPQSITYSFFENSPALARKAQSKPKIEDFDDSENCTSRNVQTFIEDRPPCNPSLLMQWQVRPPYNETHDNVEALLTPSSSMFSSAYTVTEMGSDISSDHSPPSESADSTLSSRRPSEMDDDSSRSYQDCYLKFQEYVHLFRQLTAFNNALEIDELDDGSLVSLGDEIHLNRESRNGSNKSIVFNYIPSRDQREKEEEELWVANEATYLNQKNYGDIDNNNNNKDNKFNDNIVNNLPVNCDIQVVNSKGNSSLTQPPVSASQLGSVQMTSSATQTTYSCLLAPAASDGDCKDSSRKHQEKRSQQGRVGKRSSPVLAGSPSTVHLCNSASHMAALICPVNTNERRHFSARQRLVQPESKKDTVIRTDTSTLKNRDEKDNSKVGSITSATTNQPTKRFSFLIRSNSIEQDKPKMNPTASASDKAILEKLAELKLDDVKENVCGKKTNSATTSFHPPCRRCHGPVYPQERIQPSKDILFHTSCFKCYECGARLNLKTFYRSPVTLRDYRIFCKSHVPSLDPGKVTREQKITLSSNSKDASRSSLSAVGASLPAATVKTVSI